MALKLNNFFTLSQPKVAFALVPIYPYGIILKRYATHKSPPLKETITDVFTPKGLAFEPSDSYLHLDKRESSNKKVNKKFIKFFKHWYFDVAPIYEGNKQVRDSSLLVLPSSNLQRKKKEPLSVSIITLDGVITTSATDSVAVDGIFHHSLTLKSKAALTPPKDKEPLKVRELKSGRAKNALVSTLTKGSSFKPAPLPLALSQQLGRGGLTKLYLQNTLRGEWFLLKKVTGLKNCLTTFVNQGNNPAVKLSDRKLDARGLEAKTTNLNSIVSFWLLAFVAFMIRLKWENPDLNLFLTYESSIACMIVPQTTNVTPKGIEASRIKAVLLLPKRDPLPQLPYAFSGGSSQHNPLTVIRNSPLPGSYPSLVWNKQREAQSIGGISPLVINGVKVVGTPTLPLLGYYGKGITKGCYLRSARVDFNYQPYYSYNFFRENPTPHYSMMFSKASSCFATNHYYSKKIAQEEYSFFKKSQPLLPTVVPLWGRSKSLFLKSPGVMGLRSRLVPDLFADNGTYFPNSESMPLASQPQTPMGFVPPFATEGKQGRGNSTTTQTTQMYIKASYLLSNLVKAQSFNNGYCFSYLPPVTKLTQTFNKQSTQKKNSFEKQVQKNKMSIKGANVYNFIANGLTTVSVPNVLVDKKEGLYLAKYAKKIVIIHATHQVTPPLVNSPNVWGPTKLIELRPGLLINSAVSLVRDSLGLLPLRSKVEQGTNKTLGAHLFSSTNTLFDGRALVRNQDQGGWSSFKLDSVKSHRASNLSPLTLSVEGRLQKQAPFKETIDSKATPTTTGCLPSVATEGSSKVKAFSLSKDTKKGLKGLIDDTVHVLLFRTTRFFQTLLWDINIYNVLWLKSLILKNGDLTFKNHLYDRGSAQVGIKQSEITPMGYIQRGTYANTHAIVSATVEKKHSQQPKPRATVGARFVAGKKVGNTKLLRSFMLLMNHKKFQAKKKLTPFSISSELSFKEALSSKVGKRLSTVYEMRKLEKQEYRAQKENIETMSARPKKRKRFYPRPDWLRVRLYETLLTTYPSGISKGKQITPMGYIKPNKATTETIVVENNISSLSFNPSPGVDLVSLTPTGVRNNPTLLRKGNRGLGYDEGAEQKKTKTGFREKRSTPFYRRSSTGWGNSQNSFNALLLPRPTSKGVLETPLVPTVVPLWGNRAKLVSNFQALFKLNPFILDEGQVRNNLLGDKKFAPHKNGVGTTASLATYGKPGVDNSDALNKLNAPFFRVWFFNTFYNFDSSNFLEVNNLSMLRIFWSLNQTNMCSINSFRDTPPNPEIWLNTFRELAPGLSLPLRSKVREQPGCVATGYVFKGFTPFASQIEKMSPTEIRARFASSGSPRGVKPSFFSKAGFGENKNNSENNDKKESLPKGMQTYVTESPNLTGRLSSFFHDSMPPLKQSDKKQAQKKKRRKEAASNEVPYIAESPVFNNRNDVWWNQKARELAQDNKTKYLIRELSIKISSVTLPSVAPVSKVAAAASPESIGSIGVVRGLPYRTPSGKKEQIIFNLNKYRQKQQKLNYLGFIPYSFKQPTGYPFGVRAITYQSPLSTVGSALLSEQKKPAKVVGKLPGKTRFTRNWLGSLTVGSKLPKRSQVVANSSLPSVVTGTLVTEGSKHTSPPRFEEPTEAIGQLKFEQKRLSPFLTSSAVIQQSGVSQKEYTLGTKKQMLEKKTTSKFWWLKNASFKALYAQHRAPTSGKSFNAKFTTYKGTYGRNISSLTRSRLLYKAEATTMLHVMHGRTTERGLVQSSLPYANTNENKPLPLLTWLTSLSQPSASVSSPVRTGYTTSSLNNTFSWENSLTDRPVTALKRSQASPETLLSSLFSMATTVFFHFCCLIGLLSISQVRCAIKFYFILFYKSSKSYIQLINSLLPPMGVGQAFQEPVSFFGSANQHLLSHTSPNPKGVSFATTFAKQGRGCFPSVATEGRVNSFFKYSKGLVLGYATKSFTSRYLHAGQASAVLSAWYPQTGVVPSRNYLVQSRLLPKVAGSTTTFGGEATGTLLNPVGGSKGTGSMKNIGHLILVWLNKRAVFLEAVIPPSGDKEDSVLSLFQPLSWEGKKEFKVWPNVNSLTGLPLWGRGRVTNKTKFDTSKAKLARLWHPTSVKLLLGLQLQIELLNAKKSVSLIRTNTIKTTLSVFKKSRSLLIRSASLLVFFIQDCFEAILRFFENPTELSLDFFAYTFLVELYSDSLSIMPEAVDLTIWSWFQKTTGSLKTSLFFGNLLQRRFFCFFYILLNTLNQPDTSLIRQQVKGTLFWDLWADLLIKTVTSENQLDVSSLARLEEERTSLVDSLLFEAEVGQLPSLFSFLLPLGRVIGSMNKKSYNTKIKFLHLTQIKHNFLSSANLTMVNPLEIITDSSGYNNPAATYYPTPYRVKKESNSEKKWGANQHVSYQQMDTDLFVDLNVNKSFSHVSGIKYYAGVQHPIGSLVCQIYTGLFETQAAKNVLVIGPSSASTKTFDSKSLLIQALAGETEIKIIIDNAARYTLVNRGLAVGIRLLKEVFNAIALQTPCFFLLEDVHLIGEKRLLLISDSSDAKKILNNKMPLSHIDASEVHEKSHVMIQYSKQAVTHYKKPYRDSTEHATSQYCFDFFLGNKKRNGGKRVKGTSLPSAIPLISFSLNQSTSTKQILKPTKVLNEISFEENAKESELILVPRINYSVRLKVALLAQHTLSNFSAKVDMITDLLVIIDNVRSNKGFVVFATTNRAHRLDPALRRPGRLDETIRVPFLPTASARWEILKSNLGVFFKPHFSPFHVKRSVCLDLIEFTNFSIQANSSLIMPTLPPFYPLALLPDACSVGSSTLLPFYPSGISPTTGGRIGSKGKHNPLTLATYDKLGRGQLSKFFYAEHIKIVPTVGVKVKNYIQNYIIVPTSQLEQTIGEKGLVGGALNSQQEKVGDHTRSFRTPKKVVLLGDISSERVKVVAYCKVAKKLILNSRVALGWNISSSTVASLALFAKQKKPVKPNSITSNVCLPSVYAKGNTLYWNSIALQEKTFITTEQKNQRFAAVGTTPLQLPGGSENAKDLLLLNTLDLEKREGEWEIPQDTTDTALSMSAVKRKLLDLFAAKVAESFVCELFCPATHLKIVPRPAVESQSLVVAKQGLGKKSAGFFNAFTLSGDRTSNDWKKASSLVKSFLQKRYMYNKNTIVNSLLCVANGSFVGEFKDEPTNPPHSVILAPSKRYENYKKIFEKHEKKVYITFAEKVQLHEQQKLTRNLYTQRNFKGAKLSEDRPNTCLPSVATIPTVGTTLSNPVGVKVGQVGPPLLTVGSNPLPKLPTYPKEVATYGKQGADNKKMKWGREPMNKNTTGETFRPGFAVTDSNTKERSLNNSIEGNYSTLSSVSWYYNASLVKRHQFYLTNQWFNGQLAEHNAETVFLSDVDWRLTFIEGLGDLSIDFPDADQLYNPRHRRWLLNTSSLSGGTASSWHTFYNYEQEISDHLVMQAFNQVYVLLDKNRQQLDALAYKLIKTGFLKELHLVKLVF